MALVLENCIYLFIYFKRGAKIFLIPKFYLSIGNQFYVCFFFFFLLDVVFNLCHLFLFSPSSMLPTSADLTV